MLGVPPHVISVGLTPIPPVTALLPKIHVATTVRNLGILHVIVPKTGLEIVIEGVTGADNLVLTRLGIVTIVEAIEIIATPIGMITRVAVHGSRSVLIVTPGAI